MVLGIHHISMKCGTKDAYDRTADFYRNVLGLTVRREWEADMMLDTGAGLIEIFNNQAGAPGPGVVGHFAMATDDVDALVRRIRAAGYEVFVEPKDIAIPSDPPYPARIAFCIGPMGEEIELFQER